MITQLSQLGQTADPVDALAACAADPPACKNFSTVLVNLTNVPANRRVLELISGAMAQGSQNGTNPFYASPFAVDIMRLHADADPDAASDLLIQATEALLADPTTANTSQGKDGFFAHVMDGLVARILIFTKVPAPSDLRTRVMRLLQTLAASTTLSDTAQRASAALGLLQPAPTPAPVPAPTPVRPASAPTVATAPAASVTAAPSKPALSRTAKLALAVGFGVVAVAGVAILITFNAKRAPARSFGQVYRRRS